MTKKVLICDDEEILRDAIVFDLKRKGYQPFEAENGTQGLELFKSEKIDLFLTDIRMPGGNGVDLIRSIRQIDPSIPGIVFITETSDLSRADAFGLGVDAIFSKPFQRPVFLSVIEKILRQGVDRFAGLSLAQDPKESRRKLSYKGAIQFGRVGFFIPKGAQGFREDECVDFEIQLESGDFLSGIAVLRFLVPDGAEVGAGLEIVQLDPVAYAFFQQERKKTPGFLFDSTADLPLIYGPLIYG